MKKHASYTALGTIFLDQKMFIKIFVTFNINKIS